MTLFKLHAIFGLSLISVGIIFDFGFVQAMMSNSFKTDPNTYIISFKHQLYGLTAFYIFMLGFLNIALALLIRYLGPAINLDWIILGLIFAGSIITIATGFWYADAGPSFKWEPRCTVLTIGLIFLLLGLGTEIYRLFSLKSS